MSEQRNAGRRVISQADAEAIAAKSGVQKPGPANMSLGQGFMPNKREFLAYAMAGSGALFTVGSLAFMTSPDPAADPMLGPLLNIAAQVDPSSGEKRYPVAGGFAYPRIKANTFGGKFTLTKKAGDFKDDDPPELNPDGKFFVVKIKPDSVIQPVPGENGVNADNLMAIYQVCVHLGCLVPYDASEKRFICPCHGSTYERDTQFVRGPAPRDLDQFPVTVINGNVIVDTGKRIFGKTHS